jgi:hypothetical protein
MRGVIDEFYHGEMYDDAGQFIGYTRASRPVPDILTEDPPLPTEYPELE